MEWLEPEGTADEAAEEAAGPRLKVVPPARPPFASAIDLRSIALNGLFVIAAVTTLRFTRDLFLPIVLAVLLKFLLNPIIRLLVRMRVPITVASFLVVFGTVTSLAVVVQQTYQPAQEWLGELPKTLARAEKKLRDVRKPVEKVTAVARQVDEIAGDTVKKAEQSVELKAKTLSQSFFAGMRTFAGTALVTVVLLFFLLASGDLFLRKMVRVLPRWSDKKRAVAIARKIEGDVSKHLLTISLINLTLGGAVATAMHLLDMPNPLLWGVMATCFNFAPYVGAAVGVATLSVASFLAFEQPAQMVLPPIAYLALTSIEGTLITPTILGRRLALNTVAVFLGLMFWGFLWGVPGALIAVPLMVAIKVFCDRVPPLAAIGEFMGR